MYPYLFSSHFFPHNNSFSHFSFSPPPLPCCFPSITCVSASRLITSSALPPSLSSLCFFFIYPVLSSPSSFISHISSSSTALFGADVWCGACGGGGGEGIEPQSGNWSEATQLHLASDLATRDQPHELPAHGKCFHKWACRQYTLPLIVGELRHVVTDKHSDVHKLCLTKTF